MTTEGEEDGASPPAAEAAAADAANGEEKEGQQQEKEEEGEDGNNDTKSDGPPAPDAAASGAGTDHDDSTGHDSMGPDDDDDEVLGDDDDDEEEDEEEDDPMAHLPDYVIARVDELRVLDTQRTDIMQEYLKERAALEQKYASLVQPLYDERTRIVQGTEKEGEGGEENGAGGGNDDDGGGGNAQVRGIPQFWACAMTHNETTGELITEDDVDCLESLVDVTCKDHDDGMGFTLSFKFAPNDYFSNEVLTKSYDVPNLLLSDEPLLKGVKGTKVEWKSDDRALTYRMVKKKQRGKGKNAGQVRTVTKREELESFFKWFEPPAMPALDTIDEEEAERLEELFDDDYEVAEAFRSHVIPRAVLWFSGEAEEEHLTAALVDGEQLFEDDGAPPAGETDGLN